ncbi:MAG: MMPL family transporter, partial [Thermodesulfobacteriota bacterium]|nr:MMPL family transporter [Thermodesulfobacteriota bacterium]
RSVARINSKFAGTNQMLVVVRGEKPEAVKNPQIIMKIEALERSEKEDPRVGGSISVVSLIKNLHKCYHYDCPKWFFVPEEDYLISGYFRNLLESGEPGDFNRFADWSFQYASINFFLKDHKGDTIRHVIKRVKDFISKNTLPGASFELAGGFIGLVAAANEVIARSHEINLFVILSLTYIFCALAYRSFVGGILFIISLLIANIFTLAVMAVSEIGLNVNTIPVITLGIGLGVDYGLYVVSRIKEEYVRQKNLEMAVITSISTAGKAVVYTATLITFGVVLWYFSPLRFQAEMGLLLALVLIMNMLGAIFLIPTLIYFVKPRFIKSLRR